MNAVQQCFDCGDTFVPPHHCRGKVVRAMSTPPVLRKDTNPKDSVATARLDMTLFPSSAIAYGSLAMTEGDLKYGGYNWRKAGVRVSVYLAALQRHIAKYQNGEDVDAVTHVPHLASALACLAVLVDATESKNVVDDRPPRQNIGALFELSEVTVKHLQGLFPNPPGRNTEK